MKRKRLDRAEPPWNFIGFPYHQMRVDIDDYHGLVCLVQLFGGEKGHYIYWDCPIAGKTPVCGDGMVWLQLIPDGKSHVMTAKYRPNNTVSIWYVDVIDKIDYDTDGVAVFIDKYLDVIFTPQGDFKIDDRDELDTALRSGDITQEQYDAALAECDRVVEEYCTDVVKTEALCSTILAYVHDKIAHGDQ